jgi:hypothetical protein
MIDRLSAPESRKSIVDSIQLPLKKVSAGVYNCKTTNGTLSKKKSLFLNSVIRQKKIILFLSD